MNTRKKICFYSVSAILSLTLFHGISSNAYASRAGIFGIFEQEFSRISKNLSPATQGFKRFYSSNRLESSEWSKGYMPKLPQVPVAIEVEQIGNSTKGAVYFDAQRSLYYYLSPSKPETKVEPAAPIKEDEDMVVFSLEKKSRNQP